MKLPGFFAVARVISRCVILARIVIECYVFWYDKAFGKRFRRYLRRVISATDVRESTARLHSLW